MRCYMCHPLSSAAASTAAPVAAASTAAHSRDSDFDALAERTAKDLHLSSETGSKASLVGRVTTTTPISGGCGDKALGIDADKRPVACGAGASPDTAITLVTSLIFSKGLIIPEEITISVLQSLYERFKAGLFSFKDKDAVARHTLEVLNGKYSEEWVESLLHSAHQFAEFQTLQVLLPKTNDLAEGEDKKKVAIIAKQRTIISNLEKEMDRKSLDVCDVLTLYQWTIKQIAEHSIPPSEYVQTYRYVTNYVNTRTLGKDWSENERTVMKDLAAALASKTIDILESEAKALTQLDTWIVANFATHRIPLDQENAIKERASAYVKDYRNSYLKFKTSLEG